MMHIFRRWVNRYFSNPQVIILIFLLLVTFILFLAFGQMLMPVFLAILIAFLLDGVVEWLKRLHLPRNAGVYIVFILFLTLLFALLIILLPIISRQIAQLFQELPAMAARVKEEMLLLPQKYPGIVSEERISRFMALLGSEFNDAGGGFIIKLSASSLRGLIMVLVYLILVPFLVFFFLKDKTLIFDWIRGLLPEERALTIRVWEEVNQQFLNYLRGKILEIILVWAITYATFSVLGLRYSMIISLLIGLAVLVPYIGATVMFIPVVLLAFFQWGIGAQTLSIIIAYAVLHALDGNLIAPLLLSEVVNIHPVAIIVSILRFGGMWGFWGLVFAIPLATLLHAVFKALVSAAPKEPSL
ncbi:MAG: AI-2E family transporter [Deltaproteobacteria bacterium]|nr:AI-2E family transporter [Deltaproteobacteria bacterium]